MKAFLQEGLATYAPALVALSEFRRQVRSRLQAVLDDFSDQVSGLGLTVTDLKSDGANLDDEGLNANTCWIGLRKNQGAEVRTSYHIEWDLEQPKYQQVWVGTWIYVGVRSDRDRLFVSLQKHRSPLSKTVFERLADGSPYLSAYCDSHAFYDFDQTFQALIEEWLGLLSAVGGIKPFLSPAAISRLYSETIEEP